MDYISVLTNTDVIKYIPIDIISSFNWIFYTGKLYAII